MVTDSSPEVILKLTSQFPFVVEGTAPEAAKQDILFIALHPPVIMDTLEKIRESISPDALVISLAPKITIDKISGKLNNHRNVARLIPNATSVINEGYNPISFSGDFKEKQSIINWLSLLGKTFEVDESKLEAYAIISAMLPTYFWFQWETCVKIGEQIGLTDEESRKAVESTLVKSVKTLFESGMSCKEVIDLIPVKPIGDHESGIRDILSVNLINLFQKIKP